MKLTVFSSYRLSREVTITSSRVVKASDLGAEGPRFEPWHQHLMHLRGGAVAMVTELALN